MTTNQPKRIITLDLGGLNCNAEFLRGLFRHQARAEGWTEDEIESVLAKCCGGLEITFRVIKEHTKPNP